MDWTAIEDALHAWVVSATGYAAARVLWRDQNANAKVADHITLHLSGPIDCQRLHPPARVDA
jgi:hypothetical protein